jgi:hypothetical protein
METTNEHPAFSQIPYPKPLDQHQIFPQFSPTNFEGTNSTPVVKSIVGRPAYGPSYDTFHLLSSIFPGHILPACCQDRVASSSSCQYILQAQRRSTQHVTHSAPLLPSDAKTQQSSVKFEGADHCQHTTRSRLRAGCRTDASELRSGSAALSRVRVDSQECRATRLGGPVSTYGVVGVTGHIAHV